MMPSAYGFFAALGCVAGVLWLHRHRRGIGLSDNAFWAAMWTLLLGGVFGAKLLFVYLGFEHYARGELHLFADFRVGFAFFGGLVGAALAGLGFAHWRGLSFLRGADYFAVALPLGHAIGRIGCHFEGCCHGVPHHPVQLYEAAGLVLIAGACRIALARVEDGRWPQGSAFRLYILCYGLLRLLLDPLRGDGRPERFLGLSHQQGFALAAIGLALWWPRLRARGRRETSPIRAGLLLLFAGLGLAAATPRMALADEEARSNGSAEESRAAWQRVLQRFVDERGAIDFRALRKDSLDLERYVAWAARTGPRSSPERFPDAASRMAWYLDTYNALAMWNATTGRWQPSQKIRFFYLTRLPIDGGSLSLYALENDVIRPLGDPRIHFALNCMVRGCPRLPREPWSAERLDAQLDAATREFVNDARNVQLVPERRVVRLSAIFDFYTDDFLAVAPSLLAYVNRYRAEPVPEEFDVEFIPYDWTLHQS